MGFVTLVWPVIGSIRKTEWKWSFVPLGYSRPFLDVKIEYFEKFQPPHKLPAELPTIIPIQIIVFSPFNKKQYNLINVSTTYV